MTATSMPSGAHVQWTAPDLGSGTLVKYVVTAQPGGDTATSEGTQADVAGLQNGTAYTFMVAAVTSVGQGPDSTASAPITPAAVPDAPSNVTVSPGIRTATLQWTAPNDNGSPITAYVVSVSPNGGDFTAATASVSGESATVTGLANGASYRFQVAAVNAVGPGASSAASVEITLPDVPGLPVITVPSSATAGTEVTASVPAQAGVSYAWSITGGTLVGPASGTDSGGINSISFTAADAGSATVECIATNDVGSSAPARVTVQLLAAPQTPSVSAPAFVTANDFGTASVPARAGMTHTWTITGGTLTSAAQGDAITFVAGSSGTVTLTCAESNALGASASGSATVTISPVPVTPVLYAPHAMTQGETRSFSVEAHAYMTYSWTASPNATLSSTSGDTVDVTASGSAGETITLTCVETNQAGTSSSAGTVSFPIAAVPATPAISVPAYATTGDTVTASVTPRDGMTYVWSSSGGTLSSQTGASVSFVAGGPGTTVSLTCKEVNAASVMSEPASATVSVVDAPVTPFIVVNDGTTDGVTAGATETASVTPRDGMTHTWTIQGGTLTSNSGDTVTFVPDASGTVTLTCVETNLAGTSSTAATASAPIYPAPQTRTITAESVVATGAPNRQATVDLPNGSAGTWRQWTISAGTITSISTSETYETVTYDAPATAGTLTLTCVEYNAANASGTPSTFDVHVASPTVTLSAHPAQTTVTYGTDVTVTATDEHGQPLAGVDLQLAESTGQVTLLPTAFGTTDASGTLVLHAEIAAAGTYTITATATLTQVDIPVAPLTLTVNGSPWVEVDNDSGATPDTTALNLESMAIDPEDASHLWIGGQRGIAYSTTEGAPWSAATGSTWTDVWGLAASRPSGALSTWAIANDSCEVWHSTDGASFSASTAGDLANTGCANGNELAVDPSDATGRTVYAGFGLGGVYVTRDDGASWTQLPLDTQDGALRVAVDPKGTVYEASVNGLLYRRDMGASAWSWVDTGYGTSWQASVTGIGIDPTRGAVLLAASDGSVSYSPDGVSFLNEGPVGNATQAGWAALGSDGAGWVVTDENGGVYRASDPSRPDSWTKMSGLPSVPFTGVKIDPTDPLVVYAFGPSGIWKTTTAGN